MRTLIAAVALAVTLASCGGKTSVSVGTMSGAQVASEYCECNRFLKLDMPIVYSECQQEVENKYQELLSPEQLKVFYDRIRLCMQSDLEN